MWGMFGVKNLAAWRFIRNLAAKKRTAWLLTGHERPQNLKDYGKRKRMEAPERPASRPHEADDSETRAAEQAAVHTRRPLHPALHPTAALRRGRPLDNIW